MDRKKIKKKWHFQVRFYKYGLNIEWFRFRNVTNIHKVKWDIIFFLNFGYTRALERLYGNNLYFNFDILRFDKPEGEPARIHFIRTIINPEAERKYKSMGGMT